MCILFFFGPQSTSEPSSHSLSHQPHLVSSPQLPSTPPQYPQLLPHTVSSTPPASPKLYCPLHPQHYRTSKRKRVRPGKNVKRWELKKKTALQPFQATSTDPSQEQEDEKGISSTHSATQSNNNNTNNNQKEKIFVYLVPPSHQFDPKPSEAITTQQTLQLYQHFTHGTCVAAPRGEPPFCKVKYVPFDTMSAEELQGWEKLVCHFFDRTNYVAAVKNNGPQVDGSMWADGWRKGSKKESFGRYCSVGKLVKMMLLANYNPQDEAASIKEASDFISIQLQHLAPGVFEKYRETLIENNLPSMSHMEYPLPYDALDFASFLTFTMFDFHNGPHCDTDANHWTLVCWIPIFNPRNCSEDDPILADDDFDMLGGQFTFRDFQVCLDLNHVLGVALCVFRSRDYTHQTLPGASPSGKYTRIGFSGQMSEAMSNAVVAHINGTAPFLEVAGQEKQVSNAQKKL
ncbi:Leucine-zipper-like transcriptional regulator 1 [Puccinia graminis f. sp. tritici]|uniref:Leucine-zipper-like transcriptional regulator 1 n=1 Tax=Puccinia graminis f. sp. tritici TaxID=56615 RepID=A0A5B0RHP6_PUCGR|nr:Leucine-zipper-like transcriptional regulator 1 [Puccinia graminis f. sp. tritici]